MFKSKFQLLIVVFLLALSSTAFSQNVTSTDPQAVHLIAPQGGIMNLGGQAITISWSGGRNSVDVGLWKDDPSDQLGGHIVGWIAMGAPVNGSVSWNRVVCGLNMDPTGCYYPSLGQYKIILVSDDIHRNRTIASNSGQQFNTYISDNYITVTGHPPVTSAQLVNAIIDLFLFTALVFVVVSTRFRNWALTPRIKDPERFRKSLGKRKSLGWAFVILGSLSIVLAIVQMFFTGGVILTLLGRISIAGLFIINGWWMIKNKGVPPEFLQS